MGPNKVCDVLETEIVSPNMEFRSTTSSEGSIFPFDPIVAKVLYIGCFEDSAQYNLRAGMPKDPDLVTDYVYVEIEKDLDFEIPPKRREKMVTRIVEGGKVISKGFTQTSLDSDYVYVEIEKDLDFKIPPKD